MNPLATKLSKDLDPRALDEVWDRIELRRSSRSSWRAGARYGATLAFAISAILIVLGWRWLYPASDHTTATALRSHGAELTTLDTNGAPQQLALDDGSVVTVEPGAQLVPTRNTGDAITFLLTRGSALFDVRPHGPRTWTIDAGAARVTVLGTRFRVERDGDHVHVSVERGLVLVEDTHDPNVKHHLQAGQSADVGARPPAPAESAATPTEAPTPTPAAAPQPRASAEPSAPRWQDVAAAQGNAAAFTLLGSEGVARETKRLHSAAELLALADVARLSGHPAAAAAPLSRLLAEHASDPNAATAAFTLGKIQLETLAEPAAAARSFERALSLGVPRALREDTFARRVEAYAKAGDRERARTAREAYDAEFPNGRHRSTLSRWAP